MGVDRPVSLVCIKNIDARGLGEAEKIDEKKREKQGIKSEWGLEEKGA